MIRRLCLINSLNKYLLNTCYAKHIIRYIRLGRLQNKILATMLLHRNKKCHFYTSLKPWVHEKLEWRLSKHHLSPSIGPSLLFLFCPNMPLKLDISLKKVHFAFFFPVEFLYLLLLTSGTLWSPCLKFQDLLIQQGPIQYSLLYVQIPELNVYSSSKIISHLFRHFLDKSPLFIYSLWLFFPSYPPKHPTNTMYVWSLRLNRHVPFSFFSRYIIMFPHQFRSQITLLSYIILIRLTSRTVVWAKFGSFIMKRYHYQSRLVRKTEPTSDSLIVHIGRLKNLQETEKPENSNNRKPTAGGRVNQAQESVSPHENHNLREPLLEELGLQRKQLSGRY